MVSVEKLKALEKKMKARGFRLEWSMGGTW